MKKCPYCDMSNGSINTICLNCWQPLDAVEDDQEVGVSFPTVIATSPLLNAAQRQGDKVLHARHDRTFTASSIVLLGVFLFLVLLGRSLLDLSLMVLAGTLVIAGLFLLSKRAIRNL